MLKKKENKWFVFETTYNHYFLFIAPAAIEPNKLNKQEVAYHVTRTNIKLKHLLKCIICKASGPEIPNVLLWKGCWSCDNCTKCHRDSKKQRSRTDINDNTTQESIESKKKHLVSSSTKVENNKEIDMKNDVEETKKSEAVRTFL
eukprot:GHVR01013844.1.p1 GENE.GHVR01013844.1~~GHVR01013844.1.p1  ORF type:complete len:145 (-),score=5.45 GHVR01013844.1:1373-1807(-)